MAELDSDVAEILGKVKEKSGDVQSAEVKTDASEEKKEEIVDDPAAAATNDEKKEEVVDEAKEDVAGAAKADEVIVDDPAKKTEPVAEEMDESKVLAYLKAKGINADTLESLKITPPAKTDEEVAAEKEAERNSIVEYGLKNKLIKTEDVEALGYDKKRSNEDIAMELFTANQKALDKDVTDEQIEQRFADRFGTEEEDGHWKKEEGRLEMEFLAKKYLQDKHAKVNGIENIYRAQIQDETNARDYQVAVEKGISAVPAEITFDVEGTPYKYKPHPDAIAAVKDQMTNLSQFEAFGKKVPDATVMTDTILNSIKLKEFGRILNEVSSARAAQAVLDSQAGRKGVIPARETGGSQTGDGGEMDPDVKATLNELKSKQ